MQADTDMLSEQECLKGQLIEEENEEDGLPTGWFSADVWRTIASSVDLQSLGRLCSCSKELWLVLSLKGYAGGVFEFPSQNKHGRARRLNHQGSIAALSASTFLLRASWKRAARERLEQSADFAVTVSQIASTSLTNIKAIDARISGFESILEGVHSAQIQEYSNVREDASNFLDAAKSSHDSLMVSIRRFYIGMQVSDSVAPSPQECLLLDTLARRVPAMRGMCATSAAQRLYLTMRFGPLQFPFKSNPPEYSSGVRLNQKSLATGMISGMTGINELQDKLNDMVKARTQTLRRSDGGDNEGGSFDPALIDKLWCDCTLPIVEGEPVEESMPLAVTSGDVDAAIISAGKLEDDAAGLEESTDELDDASRKSGSDLEDSHVILRRELRPSLKNTPFENGQLHVLHAFRDCCTIEFHHSIKYLWARFEDACAARPKRVSNPWPSLGLVPPKQVWVQRTRFESSERLITSLLELFNTLLVGIPAMPAFETDIRLLRGSLPGEGTVADVIFNHSFGHSLISALLADIVHNSLQLLLHPLLDARYGEREKWADQFANICTLSPLFTADRFGRDPFVSLDLLPILQAFRNGWSSLFQVDILSGKKLPTKDGSIRGLARTECHVLQQARWRHVKHELVLWDMTHFEPHYSAYLYARTLDNLVITSSAAALRGDIISVLQCLQSVLSSGKRVDSVSHHGCASMVSWSDKAAIESASDLGPNNCWRPLLLSHWFGKDTTFGGAAHRPNQMYFEGSLETFLHPTGRPEESTTSSSSLSIDKEGSWFQDSYRFFDPAYWLHRGDNSPRSSILTDAQSFYGKAPSEGALQDAHAAMFAARDARVRDFELRARVIDSGGRKLISPVQDYRLGVEAKSGWTDDPSLITLLRITLASAADGAERAMHLKCSVEPAHREGCKTCNRIYARYHFSTTAVDERESKRIIQEREEANAARVDSAAIKAEFLRQAQELQTRRKVESRGRYFCEGCGNFHDRGYGSFWSDDDDFSEDDDSFSADSEPFVGPGEEYKIRIQLQSRKYARPRDVSARISRPSCGELQVDSRSSELVEVRSTCQMRFADEVDEQAFGAQFLGILLWFVDNVVVNDGHSCPTEGARALHLGRCIFEFLAFGEGDRRSFRMHCSDVSLAFSEPFVASAARLLFSISRSNENFSLSDFPIIGSSPLDLRDWKSWFNHWLNNVLTCRDDQQLRKLYASVVCSGLVFAGIQLARSAPVYLLRLTTHFSSLSGSLVAEFLGPLCARSIVQPLRPKDHDLPLDISAMLGALGKAKGIANEPLSISGVSVWSLFYSASLRADSGHYYLSSQRLSIGGGNMWEPLRSTLKLLKSESTHRQHTTIVNGLDAIQSAADMAMRLENEFLFPKIMAPPRALLAGVLLSDCFGSIFESVLQDSVVHSLVTDICTPLIGSDAHSLAVVAMLASSVASEGPAWPYAVMAPGTGALSQTWLRDVLEFFDASQNSKVETKFAWPQKNSTHLFNEFLKLGVLCAARHCKQHVDFHGTQEKGYHSGYGYVRNSYISTSSAGNKQVDLPGLLGPRWASELVAGGAYNGVPPLVTQVVPELLFSFRNCVLQSLRDPELLQQFKWTCPTMWASRLQPRSGVSSNDDELFSSLAPAPDTSIGLESPGAIPTFILAMQAAHFVDYSRFVSSGDLDMSESEVSRLFRTLFKWNERLEIASDIQRWTDLTIMLALLHSLQDLDCGFDASVVAFTSWVSQGSVIPNSAPLVKSTGIYICVVDSPITRAPVPGKFGKVSVNEKGRHDHDAAGSCIFKCPEISLKDVDADRYGDGDKWEERMTVAHLYCAAAAAVCGLSVSRMLDWYLVYNDSPNSSSSLIKLGFNDLVVTAGGKWIPPPVGLAIVDNPACFYKAKTLRECGISAGDVICVALREGSDGVAKVARIRREAHAIPAHKISELTALQRNALTAGASAARPKNSTMPSAASVKEVIEALHPILNAHNHVKFTVPNVVDCGANRLRNGWFELESVRACARRVTATFLNSADYPSIWTLLGVSLSEWSACGLRCYDCQQIWAFLHGLSDASNKNVELRLGPDRTYDQIDHILIALGWNLDVSNDNLRYGSKSPQSARNRLSTPEGVSVLGNRIRVRIDGSGTRKTVVVAPVNLPSFLDSGKPSVARIPNWITDFYCSTVSRAVNYIHRRFADISTDMPFSFDLSTQQPEITLAEASANGVDAGGARRKTAAKKAHNTGAFDASTPVEPSKKTPLKPSKTSAKTAKARSKTTKASAKKSDASATKTTRTRGSTGTHYLNDDFATATAEEVGARRSKAPTDVGGLVSKRATTKTTKNMRSVAKRTATLSKKESEIAANASPAAQQAQMSQARGAALVGRHVRVFWETENEYFSGKIIKFDATLVDDDPAGEYEVLYDDGDKQWEVYESLEFITVAKKRPAKKRARR